MSARQPEQGDNLRVAISAVLFTVFALSLGDALIKGISSNLPVWQMFVLRSSMAIPVLIALVCWQSDMSALRPRCAGWLALRSILLTLMWVFYYISLPHIALSVAAAVYYTLPLFITLFAALFIGEKVCAQGWIAVSLGFCGVLLILRPQAENFNTYALLPLISAIFYALAMIITRTKCRNDHYLTLSFWLNVSMICVGVVALTVLSTLKPSIAEVAANPFMLQSWTPMVSQDWLAIGLLALAILVGSVFAAIAYQRGPSSVVSTFDFAYLAFATIWGFIFFEEVPDAIAITGIAMIVGAGILAVRRPES